MKSYDYWLFDWDGCLARTLEAWHGAFKAALAHYGAHPTDQEIGHHLGDWEIGRQFGIDDVQGVMDYAIAAVKPQLPEVGLYPSAEKLLRELHHQGKKLGVLSSSPRAVLEYGLRYNKLEHLFGVVLAAEDVTAHKPDPEIITKGLEALGGHPGQAVMVGDSRKDLGAAKNAGVDSILVYPPSHRLFYDLDELRSYGPTYMVAGFEELIELTFH